MAKSRSLGPVVSDWIERTLVHGEGDYLGEPFVLEPWQRDFLHRLYELDAQGRRRVRRALLILPKGCGKTQLIAAVCLAELAGPTVLEGSQPALRKSPNIPIAAASYEQADRLFGAALTMAREGALAPFVDALESVIRLRDRQGRMFKVAAIAGTNEGGLPTAFGADELHEWKGRKERVHLILANSLAKRDQGLELNISTPDDADPTSLLGRLVADGERVNSGEVDDPGFLYVRYGAGEHWNLEDPAELRAAIREATPASWVDVERIARRLEVDRVPEHEFRRYHLAQFVRPAGYWIKPDEWAERADTKRGTPPARERVVLGFDGSYRRDATALVGCTLAGHLFVIDVWERPLNAREDWHVPRGDVDAAVDAAMGRYDVVELAADPPGWHSEIEAWTERYGAVVVAFDTNQRAQMAAACDRLRAAVLERTVTHDAHPVLTRHVLNALAKDTPSGTVIVKEHPAKKIDAAVAAVVAYERASWHAANHAVDISANIW